MVPVSSLTVTLISTVNVAGCQTLLSDYIKLFGLILDKTSSWIMDTSKHIASASKSVHYHIRSSITPDMAMTALVGSRLNYAISVLYGTTQTFPNFRKLKISWRMSVFNIHQSNSHMLLQTLHWLTIEYNINFNIANITFSTLHYSQAAYLHSLVCFHTPACSLSSNTSLPTIPFACTALGARSFVAVPNVCNSLPPALRSCNCPNTLLAP